MIKAISNFTKVEFISTFDTEVDKTIFYLGSITTIQMANINDMLSRWRVQDGKMQEIVMMTSQRNYEVVRCGLKGWKNFKDGDKEIVFSEKNIEKIPFQIINELSDKLFELNSLSEQETKN